MTVKTPAETFEELVERQEPYFAAVKAARDLAWFEVGHKRRAEIVGQLGLPEDIAETELRRALWERRHPRSNTA